MDAPKTTQIQIAGKQINGAVIATKEVATIKLSSFGKKAVEAVKATTHAFGFIN